MTQLIKSPKILNIVLRLSAAQALAGANASVIFATGALVGRRLAPSPDLATLPITLFVVGMAIGTLPSGFIAKNYGRRASFLFGAICGLFAGLLGAIAVKSGDFWLYGVATFFGGIYGAVVQSFRFAATDATPEALRPKAISWVMAGGVFAGVLGPQLVNYTMNLSSPLFMVSYYAQAAVAVLAGAVLWGVKIDSSPVQTENPKIARPLKQIIGQKTFILAALSGVVSYGLMNLMMTSAPLAMNMCGLTVQFSNLVIEWHIIAMFAPSFFTGSLIEKFGVRNIIALGLIILAGAGIAGLSGISQGHFMAALVLLGLGWNFGFLGASNLVLSTHTPDEKNKVQSFNDFLVFGTMAVGSFLSGKILDFYGWQMVNYVVLIPSSLMLAILLIFDRKPKPPD